MAERDTRTSQEKMLHVLFFAQKMLENGKADALIDYLMVAGEEAQAGMSTVEVDAVRMRVDRAVDVHLRKDACK